jgi:hypothetical protein
VAPENVAHGQIVVNDRQYAHVVAMSSLRETDPHPGLPRTTAPSGPAPGQATSRCPATPARRHPPRPSTSEITGPSGTVIVLSASRREASWHESRLVGSAMRDGMGHGFRLCIGLPRHPPYHIEQDVRALRHQELGSTVKAALDSAEAGIFR